MKVIQILILTLGIVTNSFTQEKPLSKEQVINLYNQLYKTSEIDSIIWNGNSLQCKCGTLEKEIYKKVEDRINFFRTVTGLNKVILNSKYNVEAQAAALLIKANNELTHYPNSKMRCYSQAASNGCLKSCLGFSDFINFPETAFITGFINDFGEDNYFVGHRKWILYTKLVDFGYGATNNSEALLTADGVTFDTLPTPEYIAYPWNGYVPVNLIFPKWSFSINQDEDVDFSSTTISMLDSNGKLIKIEKLKEYKNYLDHTIVWYAKGLFTDYEIEYGINSLESNGYLNGRIKVIIKNVRINGSMRTFEYFVEPIKV